MFGETRQKFEKPRKPRFPTRIDRLKRASGIAERSPQPKIGPFLASSEALVADPGPISRPPQLINLGLRCTEFEQRKRPDLNTEVIPVLARLNALGKEAEHRELERLHSAAAEMAARQAPGARPRDNSDILASQRYCPISHVSGPPRSSQLVET